jgi:glucose-6-phosphate isomerase
MESGSNRRQVVTSNLPGNLIMTELEQLEQEQVVDRIWKRDHTVWSESPDEISNRLGWLQSHIMMKENLQPIYDLAAQVQGEGYTQALLVGMGGSSMAPEVFRKTFGVRDGYLDLDVLDSTDPGAVLEKEKWLDPRKTLFIVSTKSGGTVETLSLMKYFYNKTGEAVGRQKAGEHFIAITDPGSSLEKTAAELGFRKTFLNDPEIGGRYSALSYFGLVPAGLIGVNLEKLLQSAETMAADAAASSPSLEGTNTPAWLGAVLGALGKNGRDKVTLISSPPISYFGAWLEQLLAESTGKEGRGLLPVDGESLFAPDIFAHDRLFIYLKLSGDSTYDPRAANLIKTGHPVVQLNLDDIYDLGGELFRWMMATAVAGWSLGINPFDQPNVESAKELARDMVEEYREKGKLPSPDPDLKVDGIDVYSGFKKSDLQQTWHEFFLKASPGENEGRGRSYIAIQAYLKPDPETDRALQRLRDKIQVLFRMAVTIGYGPRYLHSTGQLHKGDSGNGLFILLTAEMPEDVPIPDKPGSEESSISFGLLKNAQAMGDRQALLDAGRKVIRFHLDRDVPAAIEKLNWAIED